MLTGPPQPAHRCDVCRLVRLYCVCPLSPRLDLATRVVVVMHSREWRRGSNTGHLAQLALKNAEVRLHGAQDRPFDPAGIDATAPTTLVLFPSRGGRPLTRELAEEIGGPVTLLVPDGNWQQTKNMMKRLPTLRQARAVELPGPALSLDRPRRNVFPDRMATFEAIAQALGALEGEAVETQLLTFFQQVVDRMLMLRGKLTAAQAFSRPVS